MSKSFLAVSAVASLLLATTAYVVAGRIAQMRYFGAELPEAVAVDLSKAKEFSVFMSSGRKADLFVLVDCPDDARSKPLDSSRRIPSEPVITFSGNALAELHTTCVRRRVGLACVHDCSVLLPAGSDGQKLETEMRVLATDAQEEDVVGFEFEWSSPSVKSYRISKDLSSMVAAGLTLLCCWATATFFRRRRKSRASRN